MIRQDDKPSAPPLEAGAKTNTASTVVEIVFVLGLAAATAAIGWQALSLPIFAADGTVGPGLFPIPISFGLLAGLIVYALSLMGKLVRARQAVRAPAAHPPVFDARQTVILVLLAGAALAGATIGLFSTVGMMLFVGLLTVERLKPLEALAFTIGALVFLYLVFHAWLHMNIGLNGIL